MAKRRELGIGGGAAECARRSGAGLGSRSCTSSSGRVPGLYVLPARLLGAGEKDALGAVRNPQGRTRDHDPWAGATVAPANTVPGGLTLPAAQPRPPAPGSSRSREGASPAPGAPPPPAQRSRPQPGCHHPLTPGAEDPAPPAAVPAPKGVTDRVQEEPLNFSHPLVSLREKQGTREAEGTEGRVALENRLRAYATAGLTLGRAEVGATGKVG